MSKTGTATDLGGTGATEAAPNPFDLEELRERPFDDSSIQVEKKLIAVPIRKPTRTEFFRVSPDPDYTVTAPIIEHVKGLDRDTYWVIPGLRNDLFAEVVPVRLLTCISRRSKDPFLWPAKIPGDGGGRRWAESALHVAEQAKTHWVRMSGNRDGGYYDLFVAKGDLGDPEWPDQSFEELVRIAFQGRVIDRPDHPVLQELDGRA